MEWHPEKRAACIFHQLDYTTPRQIHFLTRYSFLVLASVLSVLELFQQDFPLLALQVRCFQYILAELLPAQAQQSLLLEFLCILVMKTLVQVLQSILLGLPYTLAMESLARVQLLHLIEFLYIQVMKTLVQVLLWPQIGRLCTPAME